MRQFNILKGTRGWLWLYEKTVRWLHMRNETEVRRRTQILDFWKKHGEYATKDAFGVSRRTLFRWKMALDRGRGRLETLDPESRAPKNRRKRKVAPEVEAFIVEQRTAHPRLGKKKLAPLLRTAGFTVSEPYVGRVLPTSRREAFCLRGSGSPSGAAPAATGNSQNAAGRSCGARRSAAWS